MGPVAGAVDPTTAGAAPQQTGSKPNFFERALPTIGGVLGGLAGIPLNALDAVSGVGGTAADAALAGGGAALGKTLENKLTGQAGGNGVLGAAAGGAIGQGVGEGAGALLSKIAGMGANAAAKAGGDFLQGQAVPGALGKTDATALTKLGINDLRSVPDLASHITGEDGALNQGVVKALIKNGQPVDVGGIITAPTKAGMGMGAPSGLANDLVDGETAIGDTASGKILKQVYKSVQTMLGGSQGKVGLQQADPLDVLDQSRVFSKLAAKAGTSANVEQQAVGRVYRQVANELENRAFSPGGNAVPLSDDVKSQIVDQLDSIKDSSPKVYGQLVSDVTSANNAQELRGLQSVWVRASQAAEKTAAATDKGVGTSASDIVKGTSPGALLLAGHPLTAIGSVATSLPVADRAAAGVLPKVADALQSTGVQGAIKVDKNNVPQRMASVLQRMTGALGAATGTAGNTVMPTNNAQVPDQGALMQTSTTAPAAPPNIFGALSNPQSPGAGNLAPIALQALMGMFDPSLLNGTVEGNAMTGGQNIQKAQAGLSMLPGLNSLFQSAGGAQGPVAGGIASLIPGSTASRYAPQAEQELNAIAQASGLPANALVAPQVTQNPIVAQSALQQIVNLLRSQGATSPSAIPAQ